MNKRYFSVYLSILLSFLISCKAVEELPQVPQPVVVGGDTTAMVSTVTVGKKSTVTVQVGGFGNSANTAKTNNTGRGAESGANGGHSEESTKNTSAWWLIALLIVGAGLGGWVLKSRLSVLVLLLLFPLAMQAEETEPKPRRYSYKDAHRTERRYKRAVRYYKQLNRRDERELRQDRKLQAKRLKRDHP